MSNRSIGLDARLHEYLCRLGVREPDVLRRLREETARDPMARMQIAPEQGQFMALLVESLGVRRAIEIGVYTGYSALWVALALPPDGRLVACDLNVEWTTIAQRSWREAGVAGRIDLRLGPALATLDALLAAGEAGSYDFAFIDADKEGYIDYYERLLVLLRPGGLILADNMLWSGEVADPAVQDPETEALRAFARHASDDPRVSVSMIPLADGVLIARKKEIAAC